MAKCKFCKKNEAVWAMQFIADTKPSFYSIGWHIRGFAVTKICDDFKAEYEKALYYVSLMPDGPGNIAWFDAETQRMKQEAGLA